MRPMRVLLTAFGTSGDNLPTIALAQALRARGDEPLLLLNPLYEEAARARGLAFVPVGPRWVPEEVANAARYLHPRRGAIAIWNDFYLPNVARTFETVRRAIVEHRAEVVVSHWLCFGGHFAAGVAGVHHVVMNLAPCWWYSRADPSAYSAVAGPRWLLRWMLFLPRWLVNHFIGGSLRAVCRALGVPHRRDVYFAAFREADHNLALWSPAFRPPAPDDPARATICGFPWDEGESSTLGADLERFLDGGDPPVAVTLGSSGAAIGAELYARVAGACRELGARAVLVGAPDGAGHGVDGVFAVPRAPHRLLFERCRAVIHHGGIGTLAEALRSGHPTAIVPLGNDQHDNARRARSLGGSLTWSPALVRRGDLRGALKRLLADEGLRLQAASLGARTRAEPDGAVVAARVIGGVEPGA
jgi:rhamnosyltransferase subunit B